MTDAIVVFITASSEEEAAVLGRGLVDTGLAGCVNIVRGVRSIYKWQGNTEEGSEALMIVKTRGELFASLKARVKELHSYSVPEIISLPVLEGDAGYLGWLYEVTSNRQIP